jgi:hypothetical protein
MTARQACAQESKTARGEATANSAGSYFSVFGRGPTSIENTERAARILPGAEGKRLTYQQVS